MEQPASTRSMILADETAQAVPVAADETRRDTAVQLSIASQQFVQQSVRYLLVGVILGVLGFLVAVIPYILRIAISLTTKGNIDNVQVPCTVSELVSAWNTVEARVFFGFEVAASFCILLSWYPFKLRSASCIPSCGGCEISCGRCGKVSWATFRQFMPPLGLLLVACVPTVKPEDMTSEALVLVCSHALAALQMFVGFLASEAHVLSIRPFKCPVQVVRPEAAEYKERFRSWAIALVSFSIFMVIQFATFLVYLKRRYRTLSFVTEVVAGLAMLHNHFVIWKYSPERHWGSEDIALDHLARNSSSRAGQGPAIELSEARQRGSTETEPTPTAAGDV